MGISVFRNLDSRGRNGHHSSDVRTHTVFEREKMDPHHLTQPKVDTDSSNRQKRVNSCGDIDATALV